MSVCGIEWKFCLHFAWIAVDCDLPFISLISDHYLECLNADIVCLSIHSHNTHFTMVTKCIKYNLTFCTFECLNIYSFYCIFTQLWLLHSMFFILDLESEVLIVFDFYFSFLWIFFCSIFVSYSVQCFCCSTWTHSFRL